MIRSISAWGPPTASRGLVAGLTGRFLRAVFAGAIGPGRHLVVFTLPGAWSRGFVDIPSAQRHATRLAGSRDVYIGAGLYRWPRRGGSQEVSLFTKSAK